MSDYGAREIAVAAIEMSVTEDREAEKQLQEKYRSIGICSAAVDYGGDFSASIGKIVERAIVCAKRENVIDDSHAQRGAVAGAAHEALEQIATKCMGLSVGGKIGIARYKDHISVAAFFAVGLLNLNEVAFGIGHRAI